MAGNVISEKIKAGAVIVDVRSVDEFEDEHYPGSLNIPLGQLVGRIGDIGAKTAPIVLYCASGARSGMAAGMLRAAGYSDVTNAGGLEDMPPA